MLGGRGGAAVGRGVEGGAGWGEGGDGGGSTVRISHCVSQKHKLMA